MKITDLRCIQLEADTTYPGRYFEDRFVRPTDYYDDFAARGWGFPDNLPRNIRISRASCAFAAAS